MNAAPDLPWNVSFSYGRALQHSAIRAWGGSDIEAGQKFVLQEQRQTLKHPLVVMLLTLNHHLMKNYLLRGILTNDSRHRKVS